MGLGIKTKMKRMRKAFQYARKVADVSEEEERNTLLLCHALEKGMGVKNVKSGYGKEKAGDLIISLESLARQQKEDTYSFQEGAAILKEYLAYQKEHGTDIEELEKKAEDVLKKGIRECRAGYVVLDRTVFELGKEMDFLSFVSSRHSMRMYSDEPVTKEEILRAIEYAKQAPSACNRQPWKFYYTRSSEKIDVIREAVPKQSFLDDVPYFGVVTADRSLFGPSELNQWYVNGGIFLAFLVLSLHSLGIGSIILQYPVFMETSLSVKQTFSIKKSEEIIAVVGYGKYPNEAKCICAQRRADEEIAIDCDA